MAERILKWLGDGGSTGYLYGDYCAVMTLKTLNKLYMLDKNKIIENVMRFQNTVDGGFKYGISIYDSEHAIRILSNVGKIKKIDVEKIKTWFLSTWPSYPYLSTGDIHSILYSLIILGAQDKINKNEVLIELLRRQCSDGGFGHYRGGNSNIWDTYLAIDMLFILNTISSDIKNRVVQYILSLRNTEGDFNYSRNERWGSVRPTALAVLILDMLGSIDKMDKDKIASLILRYQREDGGFGDIFDTYLSLRALKSLGKLSDQVLVKAMNYASSLRNLDGGFGWWKGDTWSWLDSTDYAASILYEIKKLRKYYVRVDASPSSANLETYGSGWYFESAEVTLSISPTTIDFGNGTRLVFLRWEGDVTSRSPTITFKVTFPVTLRAIWKTQYYLTMKCNPSLGGSVSPQSGWYDSGAQIQILATPASNYRFSNWTGSGIGSYTGGSNPTTITINSPTTEVANFVRVATIKFFVSGLGSDCSGVVLVVDGVGYKCSDLPKVFSWDVGSSHSFAWSSIIQAGSEKRYAWSSSYGLLYHQSGSIVVPSEGGSVIASYKTQYLWTFYAESLGPDATGTVVVVDDVNYAYTNLPVSFWWDAGSLHSYAYQEYIGSASSGKRYANHNPLISSLIVSEPNNLSPKYHTEYKLVVTSGLGGTSINPPSPEGWYDEGSTVTLSVNSPVGFLVQHVFVGWSGDIKANNPTVTIIMDGHKTITANWRTDYSQLIIFLASIIAAISLSTLYLYYARSKREKGTIVIDEGRQIIEYLRRLDELYRAGKITKEAYEALKTEYEEKLKHDDKNK